MQPQSIQSMEFMEQDVLSPLALRQTGEIHHSPHTVKAKILFNASFQSQTVLEA